MKLRKLILLFILFSVSTCGCSIYFRQVNNAATDRLRERLSNERFDDIYQNTSEVTRAQLSQEKFVGLMNDIVRELKSVDPEIRWRRDDQTFFDRSISRDDNFSALVLEQSGKKVFVQIDWADKFELCGMHVFNGANESIGTGFRNCD